MYSIHDVVVVILENIECRDLYMNMTNIKWKHKYTLPKHTQRQNRPQCHPKPPTRTPVNSSSFGFGFVVTKGISSAATITTTTCHLHVLQYVGTDVAGNSAR